MAKGNDSPYVLMPEDKIVIRNMDLLRFGRADITPLVGHYGPNYLFLRNDYDRSSFLFGEDYYITDSGIIHKELGEFAQSRQYMERTLTIWEQFFGPVHPEAAAGWNNLGSLRQCMGDLTGAQCCFERALAIQEQSLGLDHPDTANSLNNLGALLCVVGRMEQARKYLDRALAIRGRALV